MLVLSFLRVAGVAPSVALSAFAKWGYATAEHAFTALVSELRTSDLHLQSTRQRAVDNNRQQAVLPRLMSPDYARSMLGLPASPQPLDKTELYDRYVSLMRANQRDTKAAFPGSPYLQKKIFQAYRVLNRSAR
eukprot:Blabericola_migrator_1__5427@NODE_2776_length_2370_cov_6_513244_g1738_i0_p3_GENE_NODE_2776_length_2370_cov_6_513244_g1738_i0NODE_2776_length_2370_cov_6_513244_g1738_i0_p3_ORF_typecomplete_len133_score10_73Pam16/PF03656_13/6_5e09_NODE_2776_length_2370_cov_6_513244_g1738_i019232321